MGLFEHFPYTNFHELNAAWLVAMMKELEKAFEDFKAANTITFADPLLYDYTKSYPKHTIVLDDRGNAFISLKAVPVGVGVTNSEYWLMIFDYEAFLEKVNKNFTSRYYRDQNRALTNLVVGDWLTFDDVLCKVTANIAVDEIIEVDVNIVHFTIEDFLKEFMTNATNLINQYKIDIDASELAYKNQLSAQIVTTTAALQAQLNAAISGVTVDSEVIDARIGANGITYSTLGEAIRTQVGFINDAGLLPIDAFRAYGYIDAGSGEWYFPGNPNYHYFVYPINGGDHIHIKTSSTGTSPIAFLRSYAPPASNDPVDFSTDPSWTSTVALAQNRYYEILAPSDAKYIYCYGGNDSRYPEVVEVNGYNIYENAQHNLFDLESYNKTVEEAGILPISYYRYHGYIDPGTKKWKSIGYPLYNYIVYPVNPGDNIHLNASTTGSSPFAILTYFSEPPCMEALADFSTDADFNGVISLAQNAETDFLVPSDGAYLYVYGGDGSRYPTNITINGYDAYRTARENIQELYKRDEMLYGMKQFNIRDDSKFKYGYYDQSTGAFVSNIQYMYYDLDLTNMMCFAGMNDVSYEGFIIICGWDSTDTYVGWYDFDTDTFVTTGGTTKARAVYLDDILSNYSTYRLRLMIFRNLAGQSVIGFRSNLTIQSSFVMSDIIRLKMMQYNIGKFNYGAGTSITDPALYAEKMPHYKKFFTEQKPDFLGLEEFPEYMDDANTHNSNDIVFDALFKSSNSTAVGYSYNQSALKTNYPLISFERAVNHGGPYTLCRYNVNGKRVAILTQAFDWQISNTGISERSLALDTAMNVMANDDYAFMVIDMNCMGNGSNVTSADELALLKTQANAGGWQVANGGYLEAEPTFYANGWILDNILYKTNGKTQFQNFKVLSDMYSYLSSDHYPVYGEFVLF